MKKFFFAKKPPEPKKTSWYKRLMDWITNGLVIVIFLTLGIFLAQRLPIFSIANSIFAYNRDNINLTPLLSGNYANATNDFDVAINNLEKSLKSRALHKTAKDTIHRQLFILHIKNGNFAAAKRMLNKVKPLIGKTQPQNIGFENLVNLFVSIDQIKQKKWHGNILRSHNNEFGRRHMAIVSAWGEASRGNHDKALAILQQAQKQSRNNGEILSQHALMKLFLQQPLTIENLTGNKKSVAINNLSLAQSRLYLQSLSQTKKWQDMENFINGLDHPLPLILLASQDNITSQTPLKPIIESPEDGLSYFVLDIAASLLNNNLESALLFCQLAHFANDKNPDAAFMLANISGNLNLTDDAFRILDNLKKNNNYFHIAHLSENDLYLSIGDDKTAKDNLIKLSENYPTIVDYQMALGRLYMDEKSYRSAEKNYATAINLIKNYDKSNETWFYYFQYAIALERQNKWALAENNFLTAMRLNPNSPDVLNYLGYSWIERRKNIGRALKMLQKANKLAPNNGAILDSLGWAYYQLGKYDTAREYLERAGQLIADDPEVNDHLGDVYWRLKQKTTAQLFWKKSLENLDVGEPRRARLEKKIRSGL
ncbi:MAG: tetratricopeptide repeat protein [Alphaproteobacteria bacterium]